ncbi:unnamed protein product, partial [Ectocarpus sp. 13 AM-2016]
EIHAVLFRLFVRLLDAPTGGSSATRHNEQHNKKRNVGKPYLLGNTRRSRRRWATPLCYIESTNVNGRAQGRGGQTKGIAKKTIRLNVRIMLKQVEAKCHHDHDDHERGEDQ